YSLMDNVNLVGVADINEQQAKDMAKELHTDAYIDHKELIRKIEAASIVVPTPAHFSISKECLENDVDILIEKPMAATVDEADELIRISESKGKIIQVGHLERFNPAVIALKDVIQTPRFIESHRLSIYNERGTDVRVGLDLMIHDIDIILSFVQSEIDNIKAAGMPVISDHVDIANARIEIKNGSVANVTASRISGRNERKIRLFQKDSYISVDFKNHETVIIKPNGKDVNSLIPGMGIEKRCFSKGDALLDELKSFVRSVIDRSEPEVTGQMGRDALKIAFDIMGQINKTYSRFLEE
ncbi:MAG: Gfo/Idh/MocA family oxidoreductase, partial [Desulfobacterales bacterium]|nr:Gfo/Idh/MocA family oxidoreductase [Desulfobacterales bacterium]